MNAGDLAPLELLVLCFQPPHLLPQPLELISDGRAARLFFGGNAVLDLCLMQRLPDLLQLLPRGLERLPGLEKFIREVEGGERQKRHSGKPNIFGIERRNFLVQIVGHAVYIFPAFFRKDGVFPARYSDCGFLFCHMPVSRVSSSISPLPARQNFMFLLYRISPDFQGENAKYRAFLRKKLQNMRFLEMGSLDFPFARRRRKRA